MARTDFAFSHRLRVRWAEADMQGIVFNGHYLTYFDVGITEYWRAIGLHYPEGVVERHGVDLLVVKSTIEYHASARFDDEVDVCCRIARVGRSSIRFVVEIHRGDDHLITGEVINVCVDAQARTPVPVPPALRERFDAFETTQVRS